MASIVRGLARRSNSNNFYKTYFVSLIFQVIAIFVSRYKLIFGKVEAVLLPCKASHFLSRNEIRAFEKRA
jgi:hypothetical protein